MTIRQCTEGRANSKVSLLSAAGCTIAAEGKFAIIYNSTTVICKFAKKLQLKFQKKHDNQHGKQYNYPYFKLVP